MAEDRQFCESCGARTGENANFCPSCGAAQAQRAEGPTEPPPVTPRPGSIPTPDAAAGAPPPPPPEQSGGNAIRNTVVVLVAIIILIVLARGCGEGSNSGSQEEGSPRGENTGQPTREEAQSPPAASPAEAPEPITLSGNGQMATEPFELDSGLAVFGMTYQGDRNFIVGLLDENGARVGMGLVNHIGPFDGSQATQTKAGQHVLDVQASGPWTIMVEQPRPSSAPETTSLNGTGQAASDFFELSRGLKTFEMTHQGSRNFIVSLLNKDGARVGMGLVNEIGPFEGSKAIQVPKNDIYLLDIQADGPWTIQIR